MTSNANVPNEGVTRPECLMEAKKITEEAGASVASEATEFDGIEKKLELMEGGARTDVNGPLIPARRYLTIQTWLASLKPFRVTIHLQ